MVAWGDTMAVNMWNNHVNEWSAEQRSMCAGSSCTGTTLRAETASMEVTQSPKPREARAVCFLSQQLPRWCCQPQGELLGSCVWQSFLLEMCSKCLPCPWHWQYSRGTGEEYSLPCAWRLPLLCHIPRLLRPLVGSPQLCLSSPSLPFFISCVHISCGTAVLSAWGCLWPDSDL